MNRRDLHSRAGALGITLTVIIGALLTAPARADDGQPRYVSGTGADKGDCSNKFRPCRTLEYAIGRAGKSDYIRAAEGDYTIDDAHKLSKILSVSGRLQGGFSKYSGYSEQNVAAKTLLIGVPPEFRERFEQAGFNVIVDRKGIEAKNAREIRNLTKQILATEKSHRAAPCISNRSEGYPCQSMSLLSHLSLQDLQPASGSGNDVWGFTDLNTQREYAIMGLQGGVAVVDVTDPEAPEQVAAPAGSTTTWRDIVVFQRYDADAKRWRAYAYVTADAVPDRLMLLDLSDLPNGIEQVPYPSDFTAAHTTYLVNADYTYGISQTPQGPQLGIAGGQTNGGNHRLYSLADPRSPSLLSVSDAGYAHDLASFAVTDSRKSSQCVAAQSEAACQILSDFNEDTVDIWDVTNADSPQRLATYAYPNASYVHSGWWTEDGRYLFVHDELDESNFGLNTTVRVFDMSGLRSPVLAASWIGPTRAIDHNGYVRGNRYYFANYSEGLTVLDITDPVAPQRVGYFDTYPTTSETGFVGAWSAYPFFASGTIAISDINTGLYLVRNEALASASGSFSIVDGSIAASEGDTVTIAVSRNGGTSGEASVQLELLHGSTQADDLALSTQTLTWASGDAAAKTATVALAADDEVEDLELVLVRLKAPQGGATISYPDTAHVHIADAGAASRLRLLDSSISVDDARGKVFVTVTRQSSAIGEARVSYRTIASSAYTGFTATQGELAWASGDAAAKSIEITLDPERLTGGQTGTFDVELSSAVGVELETSAGDTAPTLRATIVVSDSTAAAPPSNPTPPPSGGGGGGALHLLWLVLLLPFAALRRAHQSAS